MKGLTKHFRPRRVQATFSRQAIEILDALVVRGLHGRTRPEVVRRIVDAVLERYAAEPPVKRRAGK